MLYVRNILITGYNVDPPAYVRRAVKLARAEAVALWHREYLPLHFKPGAESKYGYKARSAGYMIQKIRRWRGRQPSPLVWTGDTKRQATRSISIRSGPTRTSGRMETPRYITIRPYRIRGSTRPDLAKEMTAVTAGEVQALGDFIMSRIEEYAAPGEARARRSSARAWRKTSRMVQTSGLAGQRML